jgi:hypothetical protein
MADFGWQVLKVLFFGAFSVVATLAIVYVIDLFSKDWRD